MASTLKSTKLGQTNFGEVKFEEVKLKHVRPTGLDEMLKQLDALVQSDDYDDDFQSPTPSAVERMRAFLKGASGSLGTALPLGTIYADGVGGLRVEWIRPNGELRLIISKSPEGRSYLYHEQGADYAADYSPNAIKLGKRLDWLESLA